MSYPTNVTDTLPRVCPNLSKLENIFEAEKLCTSGEFFKKFWQDLPFLKDSTVSGIGPRGL